MRAPLLAPLLQNRANRALVNSRKTGSFAKCGLQNDTVIRMQKLAAMSLMNAVNADRRIFAFDLLRDCRRYLFVQK